MNGAVYEAPCRTSTIGLSDLGLASEDNLRDLGTLCKMDCTLARSLMWISVLLHCILTPISVSQTQMSPKSEGRSFLDIYNRSKCQPRWVLLNLLSELPQFSDYLFQPPCVSVQRCAGCCLDEAQSCFPLQWHNVRMEVYRKRTGKPELTIISIVQHTECECRPHDSVTMNPNRLTAASGGKKAKKRKWKGKKEKETYRPVCTPCEGRKVLNPDNCNCICQKTEEKCIRRGMTLNKDRCRCEKPSS